MTSDSSTTMEGATSGGGGGGSNSYSQRNTLPSPWAQVVRRGGEADPIVSRSPSASPSSVLTEQNLVFSDQLTVMEPQTVAAVETQPEGSEDGNNGNASGVMRSAWNKPSANGVVEGSNTPVIFADSWPALSESTRSLPRSLSFPSESSSRPTSDGSISASQAPVTSQQPQRPVRANASHHSNQNHTNSSRQRSVRRGGGGGGGGGAGGGYNRPMPPPPPPMPPPPPYLIYDVSYGSFVPAVLDSSVREQSPYNGPGFAPRPMGSVGPRSDHPSNRKRNNFGSRPRGDGGLYLNNGHRDWRGPPRSHGAVPPQMVPPPPPLPRGYLQQAHMGPSPFIAPPPIRPYGAPMGYEMAAAPFAYVPTLPPGAGAPLFPRAASPSINPPASIVDTPLSVKILNQIEFYFSDANLVKDNFLRSNMDEEGWVPVTLIAGFRRVQILTNDIPMILNSLRDSAIVEVQGETLRRRNEWRNYLNQPNYFPTDSTSQLPRGPTGSSALEISMPNLTLDGSTPVETSTVDSNNEVGPTDTHASSSQANREITVVEQDL